MRPLEAAAWPLLASSKAERKDSMVGNRHASSVGGRLKNVLEPPTDSSPEAVKELTEAFRPLLADVFALYVKTKNFHWHMSGPHFRDYHLLLDEHAEQIFAMTDEIAERARKIGGTTLRSIGDISRHQQLKDNDREFVAPHEMLAELRDDNQHLIRSLRETHELCERHNATATASLIETWIDESERRSWFLSETIREESA